MKRGLSAREEGCTNFGPSNSFHLPLLGVVVLSFHNQQRSKKTRGAGGSCSAGDVLGEKGGEGLLAVGTQLVI